MWSDHIENFLGRSIEITVAEPSERLENCSRIIQQVVHEKAFQRLAVNFYWATGLSEALSVGEILHQAEQLEKYYDWSGAAGSYEKGLNLLSEDDFSRRGEIYERLGYASYRFAFQAESNNEFRQRLGQSAVAYEKAAGFFGRLKESVKTARTLRSIDRAQEIKAASYDTERRTEVDR